MSTAYYSTALQTNFIMEANTMNPDQTAPMVHIVFSIGHQSLSVEERADDNCSE